MNSPYLQCPHCRSPLPGSVNQCLQCGQPIAYTNPYAVSNVYEPAPALQFGNETKSVPRLASRGSRFAAIMVDRFALLFALVPGIALVIADQSQHPEDEDLGTLGMLGVFVVLGCVMLLNICQWIMISSRGQSLGKRLLGIRIVLGKTNRPPGFVNGVLLRSWLISVVSAIPVIGGLFSLVDTLLIFDASRRCLHDKMANTNVVEGNPPRKR